MIACLELFFSIRTETVDCLFGNSIPVGDIWGEKLDRLTKITMNRWTLVYYLFLVSHFFSKLPVFSSCYSSNRRGEMPGGFSIIPARNCCHVEGTVAQWTQFSYFMCFGKSAKRKFYCELKHTICSKLNGGKRRWNSEPEVNLVV